MWRSSGQTTGVYSRKILTKSSKYYDAFSSLAFNDNEYKLLFEAAAKNKITIFASVFDFESLDIMESLSCPAYKVASGDITHLPLIRAFAATKANNLVIRRGNNPRM